jgi:serine/threonine protein kinase/tetratricopeptide (TPR) repeat protein/TolB-like protein
VGLPAGIRFGPYEVVELLGAGGMGEVYRAHDPRLHRHVALKVLPERFARSPDRLRRFEREARLAGALNHPNILTVFDIGSQDGSPYLVCELLEGETLHARLRFERMDVRQVLYLALQLARGLGCAHEAGILHRDLKPSNLFLTQDGRLKILDFGLAKLVQADGGGTPEAGTATHDTDAGRAAGTAAYMSPEQIRDEPLDGRCDIFALGAVLYESLARRPAFVGATDSDVMASILRDDPPPLATLAPSVPSGVEAVVRRCLEKRREDRFGSAGEVSAALQVLLETLPPAHAFTDGSEELAVTPGQPRRPSGPSAPTLIPASGRRLPRAAIAAAATVTLLIAVGLPLRRRGTGPAVAPAGATATNSLAVMDFENLSDRTDADNAGRMLAALVTTELSSSGGIPVVSAQRVSDIARQLGKAEGPDHAVATEVARRAGAATMVLGQVMRAGPRMVATAELVDVAGGQRLGSYRAEGTVPQDVFAMAASLGSQLRQKVTGRPSQTGPEPLTGQLTTSVDAYRAYVRGETLIHRWEWEKAAKEFEQAARLDPDFALAHYRRAIALSVYSWGDLRVTGRAAAERAVALKSKLPARERAVVDGAALMWAGRGSDAVPVLEASLARDPDNKELLYLLSQCYMLAPREINPKRAAELMERVLVLDPDFRLVYLQLAVAYAMLGDFATAHARLDGWEGKEPETVRSIRSMVTLFEGRVEEALRLTESPPNGEVTQWRCYFAMHAGRFDITRGIIAEQERLPKPTVTHFSKTPSCGGVVETFALYHGQFARVLAPLREWASSFHFQPYEAAPAGAAGLLNLADLLAFKGDSHGAQRAAEKALVVQPETPSCLYTAGVFALRASDGPAAERHLRKLEEVVSRSHGPLGPHYRNALVAEMALAEGRPSDARPLMEGAVHSGMLRYEMWTGFMPEVRLREGLVRTYLALGEKEKATQVLEDLIKEPHGVVMPVSRLLALYRLGVLRMDLGDRDGGRKYLQKFLGHWGKADWNLAEVRDARARLAGSS